MASGGRSRAGPVLRAGRLWAGALLAAAATFVPLPGRAGPVPSLRTQLNVALEHERSGVHAPGVVAGVWMPGLGSWTRAIGKADLRTGAPIGSAFHFRIGSVTKTVTVTAVLLLADDGLLSLDDPVGAYVPGVPSGDEITLRMLANMTSGLFSYTLDPQFQADFFADPQRPFTPQDLLGYAFQHPLQFEPGTGWDYCNTNTVLLGLVIEAVAHQPLGEFLRERIFQPMGMDNTDFPASNFIAPPFPRGYTRQTLNDRVADASRWNPSWAYAAGNLVSGLEDVRALARLVATGRPLLSAAVQAERLTWGTLPPNTPQHKYGLGVGWDHGWIGHSGELPGFNTVMLYFPPQEATLVVLVNSDIPTGKQNPAPSIARALASVITPGNVPYQTVDE